MPARSCEACGSRMSPFQPRQRVGEQLVCKGCAQRLGSRTAASDAPDIPCSHPGCDKAVTWAVDGPSSGDWGSDVCDEHKADAEAHWSQFGKPRVRALGSREMAAEAVRTSPVCGEMRYDHLDARPQRIASQKVAHDSGDGETIYHCPFCGAGQVVGRSDGTAECGFCKTAFTVQVQPERSAVPQTINGQPYDDPNLPGSPGQMDPPAAVPPEDSTTLVPEEERAPIFASRTQSYYLTAEGVALPEEAYLRHLAIQHADDRVSVIAAVRAERDRA